MANILNTRIQLKYDSWSAWEAKKDSFKPLKGEVCIVYPGTELRNNVPEGEVKRTPCLIKVGDGVSTFAQLPWLSAIAADVHDWAKMEYSAFTAKLATDLKLATTEQISTLSGRVTTLETTVGDDSKGLVKAVADNTTAIGTEKTRAEGAEKALADRLDVVEPKLAGITTTVIAEVNGAKAYTDTEVGKVDAKVTTNTNAITLLNGDNATEGSVAHSVKTAVDAEAQARTQAVNGLDARLDVIEGEGAGSVKKALADAKGYTDEKVATINGNITSLTGRVEANEGAIAKLNGTGDGSVKKTVDDAINKFATDVTDDKVVNSYKELIDYVAEHGGEFTELVGVVEQNTANIATNAGGIAANKTAIESNDADILALQGKVSTLEGKVDVEKVSTAIATAKQAAIDAAATDATTKANAAESNAKSHATGLNTAMNARVVALEGKLADEGEGTVADKIADAKQEAIDAAATDATTKANNAEANAKAYADTKKKEATDYTDAEIKKVDGKISALHKVATSGDFTDLNDMSENTTEYVILYCGTASVFADN